MTESQIRTDLSVDADANNLPSGENVISLRLPEWPLRVWSGSPVAGFQSRTVLFSEVDARSSPFGENATLVWSYRI